MNKKPNISTIISIVIALVALFFTTKPFFTWYADQDQDSYGNPHEGIWWLWKPQGYVGNNGDCYDGNENARPGQTKFFEKHRGDGSYDYDCNGVSEREYVILGECKRTGTNTIADPRGWEGRVPAPGEVGDWLHDCDTRIRLFPPSEEVVRQTRKKTQKGR